MNRTPSGNSRLHQTLQLRYRENPSLVGLFLGMILGLASGILFALSMGIANPGALDPVFLFWSLNSGFFLGLFAGGLLGLRCHWKELTLRVLVRDLLAAEAVFLFLLLIALGTTFIQAT